MEFTKNNSILNQYQLHVAPSKVRLFFKEGGLCNLNVEQVAMIAKLNYCLITDDASFFLPFLTINDNLILPHPKKKFQLLNEIFFWMDQFKIDRKYLDSKPEQLSWMLLFKFQIIHALIHEASSIIIIHRADFGCEPISENIISFLQVVAKKNNIGVIIVSNDTRMLEYTEYDCIVLGK